MGMYYQAKLIFGLPQDEIESDDEDMIENLDRASGYYDGGLDATILGVVVEESGDYSAKEITIDLAKIDEARLKFHDKTGQDGRLYLSPHGY